MSKKEPTKNETLLRAKNKALKKRVDPLNEKFSEMSELKKQAEAKAVELARALGEKNGTDLECSVGAHLLEAVHQIATCGNIDTLHERFIREDVEAVAQMLSHIPTAVEVVGIASALGVPYERMQDFRAAHAMAHWKKDQKR